MNDTQLQIIISFLNDASAGLASVGDTLNSMADQAASAGAAISTDLQSSLDAAEEAAAAAADSSAASWGEFEDSVSGAIAGAANAAQGDFEGMSSAALAAATTMDTAFQGSVAELQSSLVELPAAAATDGAEAGAALTTGLESSVSSLGGKLMAAGGIAGLFSAAITAPIVAALGDAASKQRSP